MTPVQFNAHEADDHIMWKKDGLEVGQWIESLGFIDQELGFLIELEDRFVEDPELYALIQEKRRENTFVSGELFRHESAMKNALECDDLACDIYYLDHHEKQRGLFMEHLRSYRPLKSRLFSKILQDPKI